MKKIVLFLSIFLVAPFLMPTEAEARHGSYTRIISYHSCGAPVYQVHQFVGYDHCGTPRYRIYTRSNCRCGSRHHYAPPRHHHHQPRYHHPRSHGGISFHWSNRSHRGYRSH